MTFKKSQGEHVPAAGQLEPLLSRLEEVNAGIASLQFSEDEPPQEAWIERAVNAALQTARGISFMFVPEHERIDELENLSRELDEARASFKSRRREVGDLRQALRVTSADDHTLQEELRQLTEIARHQEVREEIARDLDDRRAYLALLSRRAESARLCSQRLQKDQTEACRRLDSIAGQLRSDLESREREWQSVTKEVFGS